MRSKPRETPEAREARETKKNQQWARWFAWKPVKVYDKVYNPTYWKWVWLETIYRKAHQETKDTFLGNRKYVWVWEYSINPMIDPTAQNSAAPQASAGAAIANSPVSQAQRSQALQAAYQKAMATVKILNPPKGNGP